MAIVLINENISKNHYIAYHGTPAPLFTKFSMKYRGKGADTYSLGDYGKGFYFTPLKEIAIRFATDPKIQKKYKNPKPVVYKVLLTMNNPLDFSLLRSINKDISLLIKQYGLFNIPQDEYEKIFNKNNTTEEIYNFMNDVEGYISDNWGDWDVKGILAEKGFDSIISANKKEYVVYSSKQIEILSNEFLRK